jgi:hypothetical protein
VNTMRVILVALLLMAVGGTASTPSWRTTPAPAILTGSAATKLYFDYVLVIIMENHNLCDVLTSCGGTATYLSGLASSYGVATKDMYCHTNPSLPNYLCLTGGSDFGCIADASPNSIACTKTAWGATNIVDRLEAAGLTWKGYMEDMPSNCYASDSGNYIVHHNPFVYYSNIANNATRCAQVVPAGPSPDSDATLLADLGSVSTASNFMWLTPNKCNDMHSCSIRQADTYMAGLVPKILDSTLFKTTRAALFVTYDEGYPGSFDQPVYTVWAGSVAKTGYLSSFEYDHFSFLSTVESNWNLSPLTPNDRDAPHMGEFFLGQPSRGVSVPPTAPFPLGIVLGIAIPVAAVAILAFLLLRRRARKKGSPAKPGPSKEGPAKPPTPGDEGADEDEWEI